MFYAEVIPDKQIINIDINIDINPWTISYFIFKHYFDNFYWSFRSWKSIDQIMYAIVLEVSLGNCRFIFT
jgi:hypothetical protein